MNKVVKQNILNHPRISVEILKILSEDENKEVRKAALRHPKFTFLAYSNDELESIVKNNNTEVKLFIASNINTPLKIINLLTLDSNDEIRNKAFKNPNWESDLLELEF